MKTKNIFNFKFVFPIIKFWIRTDGIVTNQRGKENPGNVEWSLVLRREGVSSSGQTRTPKKPCKIRN